MSTYLLDTHTWLWAVREPHRLGPATLAVLAATEHTLAISSVSVWEAAMLIERGRVSEVRDRSGRVRLWRRSVPAVEIPVDDDIALRAASLAWAHRDPADRYIVASALERGCIVLTADRTILDFTDVRSHNAQH